MPILRGLLELTVSSLSRTLLGAKLVYGAIALRRRLNCWLVQLDPPPRLYSAALSETPGCTMPCDLGLCSACSLDDIERLRLMIEEPWLDGQARSQD